MNTNRAFIFWSVVSFLVIVHLIVFDYTILMSPAPVRVQYTPDDAYYYFQLAKNFAELGYWTFDSGVSVASGFHPLLAYLLAGLYKLLQPSTEGFVTASILLSSILTLLVVIIVWVKSIRAANSRFLIALSLFAGTQSFLFNSVSAVEWPLVIVWAGLYCFAFASSGSSTSSAVKVYGIGLLLSLARSDAGLLPFSIFLAALLLVALGYRQNRFVLRNALAGLAGACCGVGLVFLNNYIFAGTFLQSSARMKLYWTGFQDDLLARAAFLATQTAGFDVYFFALPILCLSLLIPGAILAPLFLLLRGRPLVSELRKIWPLETSIGYQPILYLASYLCILGYLVLYAWSGSALQNWYTANFLVPMFILFTGLIKFLIDRSALKTRLVMPALSSIVLITIFLNILSVYPVPDSAPWPHQQAMLAAGKYLRDNHLDGRIASWNAGIIGYYQGGQVINIDGLVNESIYPYAANNALFLYMRQQDIAYLIDFETMFIWAYRQRGGYDDPEFLQSLTPLARFDDGRYPAWKHLTLYRIRNEQLE